MTGNYLYVDPDGLTRISGPYADAAERFIQLSGYLSDLRSRYADAWGNDDLGNKVSPQVQQALRTMQDQVDALGKALGMYGEGLRTTSKAYRDADENVGDAATQFRTRTERIAVDMPPAVSGEESSEPRQFRRALRPLERVQGRLLEPMEQGERVEARLLQPMERVEAGTLRPMRRLAVPGEQGYTEQGRLLAPRLPQAPIVYAGVEPLPGEFSELEPAMVGEPAQFMPAQRVRGRLLEPTQSMPAQRVRGRLLEPDEPLQAGVLMEGRLIEPTEPLRPVYKSVHPGIPAEPAHFESVQPGVPAEPLLPAHFRSVDPGIPAEPLEPLAEA